MRLKFFLIVLVLLLFSLNSFANNSKISIQESRLSKTLMSLKRIDDFPLYIIHFYENYRLGVSIPEKFFHKKKFSSKHSNSKIKWACTCFSSLNKNSDVILGRNFDWHDHPALLIFTYPKDAYKSVSMVDISYLGYKKSDNVINNPKPLLEAPLFPFDGMNEQGLAIGMMALPHADPPIDPDKKTVDSLLIIRLILDYAKNINEAINIFNSYNVDFTGGPPLHYFLTDKSGRSVIIEFINKKINIIRNEQNWQVSTNFILSGKSRINALRSSWRYKTAWNKLKINNGVLSQKETMKLLDRVSQSNTIWSILYNTTSLNISVVMGRKYNQRHNFKLKKIE